MANNGSKGAALFSESADGRVMLQGVACEKCGHLAFPEQHYGCEKCGATGDDLVSRPLVAKGTLLAFATVNLHRGKDIDAPFVVGSIRLDDGPTVRCTLLEADESELIHDGRVTGKVVMNTKLDPDNPRAELRFGREG